MGSDALTTFANVQAQSGNAAARFLVIRRAVMIGNYPPRKCGIATFTRDAFNSLRSHLPDCEWVLVAMEDLKGAYAYPDCVTHVIPQDELSAYVRVADEINVSGAELVFVQHEFGIFGGESGSHFLVLMRRLNIPVVVTLHTVLEKPSPQQKRVLDEIVALASAVIVMTERGADILARVHGAAPTKVHVIPHGAPERPFASSETLKGALGLAGYKVMMTFGLLSPNKGIETIIRGLPEILARHPDALYMVVGATHPHLVASDGEAYRQGLVDLATSLGVASHIRFIDRFVDDTELVNLLQAADLYLTPYMTEAQSTSGTLSYAIALGKPVISTPYWHACEALADGVGVICDFDDTSAFAREINGLLSDQIRREAMARRAYRAGEPSRWRRVAEATANVAASYRSTWEDRADKALGMLAHPKLTALIRMSDDCGVVQHSRFGVPDRGHGYCSDDNARALNLLARLSVEGNDSAAVALAYSCAAFLNHAWMPETGRFRNFMGFDRRWLDSGGSDDCCARCLEAVCLVARHGAQAGLRDWAANLAREVIRHVHGWPSIRSRALVIKALIAGEGFAIGPEESRRLVEEFATVLLIALDQRSKADCDWFEPIFAYDNARLPEALLLAGSYLTDTTMISAGIAALDVLMQRQTSPQGWFRPVATSSFAADSATHPEFDQQPIEALATVNACLAAWRATGEARHAKNATGAFLWFGGNNDHGLPLATPEDGVCHDALTVDGLNGNHGAESILSYLLAAAAIRDYLRQRTS